MSDQYVETGIPFLRSQDIRPGFIDTNNLKFISAEFHDRIRKSRLTPGDVAIVRTGYPGTAAVVPARLPVANCSDLVIARPMPSLDARFLAYVLNSPWGRGQINGRLVGAAQQHFNVGVAQLLEIPFPPLETQRRIASLLSAYDDLIEVNRRRIAVLEEMARGLFEEWFVRFRFPGHEAVPILDTPDGPLPEGWTWGAFRDLAREVRQTVSPNGVPPDTPYVGLEHLPRRSFTLDQNGQAEEVSSLKSQFQRGDILFGKIRPYFHKVIWARFDGVSSTDAIIWRPVAGLAAQALATASSDAFVAHSVQTSNGTKMPRANTRVLADYRCALAPSDISNRFEDTVGPMVEICATLQAGSRRLAASRDLLLPRLISGQLSVTEAERELEQAA
jgi:type I restriction enzyme S subunit